MLHVPISNNLYSCTIVLNAKDTCRSALSPSARSKTHTGYLVLDPISIWAAAFTQPDMPAVPDVVREQGAGQACTAHMQPRAHPGDPESYRTEAEGHVPQSWGMICVNNNVRLTTVLQLK